MGFWKTIREFHWITKIVIALTVLLLGFLLAAMAAAVYQTSHQNNQAALNASQGFGMMVMSLSWILTQAFLVVLVIIAIYMAITRVKVWIEKYLDAMLAEQKTEREATAAAMAAMNEKFTRMEQKLDRIETILEKVGE
ncbi:MAG: hypothetical protein WC362_04130 [Methanoregula sp.]|jgi:predicted membrane protein